MGPESLYLATLLCLSPPTKWFPWVDLRKIFRGCQWMAKVRNVVEHCQKFQPAE